MPASGATPKFVVGLVVAFAILTALAFVPVFASADASAPTRSDRRLHEVAAKDKPLQSSPAAKLLRNQEVTSTAPKPNQRLAWSTRDSKRAKPVAAGTSSIPPRANALMVRTKSLE